MPHPSKMTVVFGAPIEVPHIEEPSDELVSAAEGWGVAKGLELASCHLPGGENRASFATLLTWGDLGRVAESWVQLQRSCVRDPCNTLSLLVLHLGGCECVT
jgi:hypothetical protein